jgi:GTP cyclohydrolase II
MASHPFEIASELGLTAVERSLAEIRAGRPVLVEAKAEGSLQAALVTSVESLEPELCVRLAAAASGRPRLVLAAARLRRLGVERTQDGVICCPILDRARIVQLALKVDARIDAPVAPPAALDEDAIELMRLALVLPAALVVPVDPDTLDPSVLRVASDAVRAYRRAKARDVKIVSRAPVPLEGAPETEFVVFRGGEGLRDQVAIVVGSPDLAQPVSVRLHSACLTGDLFGSLKCDCGDQLRDTVRHMAKGDGGLLLYLDQEGRGNGIANKIRAYKLQAQGYDTYDADEMLGFDQDQRRFEFAAEMLRQLGVTSVRIMTNNPVKIAALADAGLEVVSEQRVMGRPTAENVRYLASKRDRAGHFIDLDPLAALAPAHD